jgi:nucleoside-diphosphate-sugar epimerase
VRYNSQGSWGHLEELEPTVRDAVEIVQSDVRDPFGIDRIVQGREVVFHLAALIAIPYSYRAPQSYVDTNVTGTLNVLEACRRHAVDRVVHTSTSETYGTAQYTPIDENHPLQGQSPYSASKIAADKLAESYFRSFDLPVATLRPFNTYGPRQSARAVIPAVITQALGSREVRLGSLSPVRDLTYVEDTTRGFLAIAS